MRRFLSIGAIVSVALAMSTLAVADQYTQNISKNGQGLTTCTPACTAP